MSRGMNCVLGFVIVVAAIGICGQVAAKAPAQKIPDTVVDIDFPSDSAAVPRALRENLYHLASQAMANPGSSLRLEVPPAVILRKGREAYDIDQARLLAVQAALRDIGIGPLPLVAGRPERYRLLASGLPREIAASPTSSAISAQDLPGSVGGMPLRPLPPPVAVGPPISLLPPPAAAAAPAAPPLDPTPPTPSLAKAGFARESDHMPAAPESDHMPAAPAGLARASDPMPAAPAVEAPPPAPPPPPVPDWAKEREWKAEVDEDLRDVVRRWGAEVGIKPVFHGRQFAYPVESPLVVHGDFKRAVSRLVDGFSTSDPKPMVDFWIDTESNFSVVVTAGVTGP